MDGANAWQKFRTVTVTFLRPAMLPYAIYGFVITFNLFFLSFFMTGGEPFGRTEILVTQAYRLVNDRQLYGVAAAFCRLPVLPAADRHADHQPPREGDQELCRLTAAERARIPPMTDLANVRARARPHRVLPLRPAGRRQAREEQQLPLGRSSSRCS